LNECSSRLIKIVKSSGAPLFMEVVKSIATLCREDAYMLWYELVSESTGTVEVSHVSPTESKRERISTTGPCWKCESCGKIFNDVKHLVNHITFYVRQRDRAHMELYQKIKRIADEKEKTFTEVVMEVLKC
jgi:uncharacterized C2H2 Zn-finger protein